MPDMSDNRKILVAKRKEGRSKYNESVVTSAKVNNKQDSSNAKKGIKRPVPSVPNKNLANNRLKRLRTNLNEQVLNSFKQSQTSVKHNFKTQIPTSPVPSARKRPSSEDTQNTQVISVTKVPKNSVCDFQTSTVSDLFPTKSTNETDCVFNFKDSTNQNSVSSVTTVTLSPISSLDSLCKTEEAMEWSPTEDDGTDEPKTTSISPSSNIISVCNTSQESSSPMHNAKYFYIVVDTNIFISQMQIIRNIVEMDVTGTKLPLIYIPWIVIEELDFIKEDSNKNSLKWKAQEAIKYIEKNLAEKNERMMGQTLDDANEQKNMGKGQDNKIISCCLQVLEKKHKMILVTDDINLRNKAHINRIPVCSHKEILKQISETITSNNQPKSQIILEKMTSLCSAVIKECALKAYGQACYKMPIYQNVPNTIQDCIKIFTKYWFPVFQETIMKQFKKSISDLSSFLVNNSIIKDDAEELNDLLRLCVRVCIFLKDVESCKSAVERTIREINSVKDP